MNTLPDVFLENFNKVPDRLSVVLQQAHQPDLHITYRELVQGAIGYAQAFSKQGIHPGETIILVLQHGADLIYSFFGAILLGSIPSIMPFLTEKLSPERYQEDMAALIKITRPAAIVTYPEFLEVVRGSLHAGDTVRTILDTSVVHPSTDLVFNDLPGLKREPKDIVLLQHSSGTTGLQKGVALSHRAVLNQLSSYAESIRLNESDVIVSWLPLYHDMGLIAGFILPILNRVPLVLISPFDWVRAPYRLFHAITQYRGTLCWLPNFAYNFCSQKIRDRDLEGIDLSSLRAVINCSEPMRWESFQMFLKRFQPYNLRPEALSTCYAMAENVFAVTQGGIYEDVKIDEIEENAFTNQKFALPASEGKTIRMLSAGCPISNTRVRILEDRSFDHPQVNDQRRELPDRQIGEIALLSDCMLTGYYNPDDLTQEAFHKGWYLTGDLGYMVDGEVYVIGRKKDLIIVGGKNIYPQDLESLANQVSGVHSGRVVAFGIFNPELGTEEVVIVAEADDTQPESRRRIADQVRQRVTKDSAIALRYVQIVDPKWILKTSSGKIARRANRDKYVAQYLTNKEAL